MSARAASDHAAGCPMEVSARTIELLRRMLSDRCAQRDTARAALRKIVETPCGEPFGELRNRAYALNGYRKCIEIATDALAGGEANEGSGK